MSGKRNVVEDWFRAYCIWVWSGKKGAMPVYVNEKREKEKVS